MTATSEVTTEPVPAPAKPKKKTLLPAPTPYELAQTGLKSVVIGSSKKRPVSSSSLVDENGKLASSKQLSHETAESSDIDERFDSNPTKVASPFGVDVDERLVVSATRQLDLDEMRKQINSINSLMPAGAHSAEQMLSQNRHALSANTSTLSQLEEQLRQETTANEPVTKTQEIIGMLRILITRQQNAVTTGEAAFKKRQVSAVNAMDAIEKRDSDVVRAEQLPPIRGDANTDDSSLLVLDGRPIHVQPDQKCIIK